VGGYQTVKRFVRKLRGSASCGGHNPHCGGSARSQCDGLTLQVNVKMTVMDANHRGGVPSSYLWFVVCPRIEQQHTRRREVFGVPGHDVQAVASRHSSNETVACGNDRTRSLRGGCEFSPGVAGFEIDGKDPVGVITFEGLQPRLEFTFVLAFLEKSNSFGDFSDGYDTDIMRQEGAVPDCRCNSINSSSESARLLEYERPSTANLGYVRTRPF
jgi:hypothetical protein